MALGDSLPYSCRLCGEVHSDADYCSYIKDTPLSQTNETVVKEED